MIDQELIKRCQEGDEEAFDSLYKSCYRKTVRTASLICANSENLEDIVQETFYECFRDIPKLRKPEMFQAWFNRILVRKCQKHIRKRVYMDSLDEENAQEIKDRMDVQEMVETSQTNKQLMEAIERLDAPFRTTIILYYFNELSIREIAGAMHCMQGTVKSRLYYAKKKLEREIGREQEPGYRPAYLSNPGEGTIL